MLSPALDDILKCARCSAAPLEPTPDVKCKRCGWAPRVSSGILDFVDESQLGHQHHLEVEAQGNAVGEYYENEEKVTCHWDRITAEELPVRLGSPVGRVLDLGTGTGTAGAAFKRVGATVIGTDLTLACLAVAKRRLDAVVRADAVALPFADGSFDAAVSRGALHHFHDPRIALAELKRVLRPGARVLLADPREFQWLERVKHAVRANDHSFTEDHRAYSPGEYRDLVAEHFEIEGLETIYPFGMLVAGGLDLFPLPRLLPKHALTTRLVSLDRALNRTLLRRAGHLLVVVARRAA